MVSTLGMVELMDFIYDQTIDYTSRGPEEYDFIQYYSKLYSRYNGFTDSIISVCLPRRCSVR